MGLSYEAFLDWFKGTGPIFLSDDRRIINDVSRRSYMLGKFLKGKPANHVLQGGSEIRETIYLDPKRTFRMFNRGDDITWQNPQKDVVMKYPWRFGLDELVWDEFEYITQTDGLSGSQLKVKYKDMAFSKKQRSWESNVDGVESKLFQSPAGASMFAEMEGGGDGSEPYSIPVFVNEQAGSNGRFDSNWTTIADINPATYSAWDNKRRTYNYTDMADTGNNGTGLFNAFDRISMDIGYRRPGIKDEFFESGSGYGDGSLGGDPNFIIACSLEGKAELMRLHRQSNDSLITPQDASHPRPAWNGTPIEDIDSLDTAALYSDGSTGFVSELSDSAAKKGPRYYFLNCQYLNVFFHREKYFKMEPEKDPERKVGVRIIPIQTWFNVTCTSRRRQGLVSPA